MGFCADWAAHWRWMAADARHLWAQSRKEPGPALKRLFLSPTMFAFVFFLATLYYNSVLSVIAERQGNRLDPVLEDEGFEELGSQLDYFHLPDYMLYALVAATAVRFLPLWPCTKPAIALIIIRRWLFMEGVIFLLRGSSVAMTSYPQPSRLCVTTATGHPAWEGLRYIFGASSTCGDCMFSGHTAAITLLTLFWVRYSRGEELAIFFGRCQGILTNNVDLTGDPIGWKLWDFVMWAYAIVCYYLIILTRFHYSADIFMGFLITYFFFYAYHYYIKLLGLRQGSFFSRFMRWFEGIQVAQELTAREQRGDLEMANASHPHANAPNLGQTGTKENAVLTQNPPGTTALPISYLEGQAYYRAGAPDNAADDANAQTHHAGPDGQQQQQQLQGSDAPVRVHMGPGEPGGSNEAASASTEAGHTVHVAPQGQQPLHNYQQPVSILVTGEQAAQEARQIERERGLSAETLAAHST